jgi:hypothetical protein
MPQLELAIPKTPVNPVPCWGSLRKSFQVSRPMEASPALRFIQASAIRPLK